MDVPGKTSASADRLIVKQFKKNRLKPAAEVVNEMLHYMGIEISPQTVRNKLYAQGFHGRIDRKKPYINNKNQIKRKT